MPGQSIGMPQRHLLGAAIAQQYGIQSRTDCLSQIQTYQKMENILVNRSAFTRLRQADLQPFAQHCTDRIIDNPAYEPLQAAAREVKAHCAAYALLLAQAQNRGRDAVVAKDQARLTLVQSLHRLADGLDVHAQGDPTYLINAGMTLRDSARRRYPGIPAAPENLRVRSTQKPGEALVVFDRVEGARMYALEWCEAPGAPEQREQWQNGNYSTARRVVIALPSRKDIRVRVRALNPNNRVGAWSVPATVFVP